MSFPSAAACTVPDMEGGHRVEHDSLGDIRVPREALYGAQTQRALENFDIAPPPVSAFPTLVAALGMVKLAALRANLATGAVSAQLGGAIEAACREMIAGDLNHAFPIPMLQGGAGTSTNMNANEVIANRAGQILGGEPGVYDRVHPNDHVNASQSTNDVYPTAARLAVVASARTLTDALANLAGVCREKGRAFAAVPKLGRTQLQDAVPMTLGREFDAFASALEGEGRRVAEAVGQMFEVNLGGTAVGTGVNASSAYADSVIDHLAAISGLPVTRADDLMAASWDLGAFVSVSGALRRAAVTLSKISNDLRLLSSGPAGGLGEIRLPAKQPGSSIMPGKVNPVIPEVVTQAAYQVIGADLTVTMAAEAGQLQLNAMEPVVVLAVLESIDRLARAARTLEVHCIRGIEADATRCLASLAASTAVATLISPIVGYARASDLARRSVAAGVPMATLILEEGVMDEAALKTVMEATLTPEPAVRLVHSAADR